MLLIGVVLAVLSAFAAGYLIGSSGSAGYLRSVRGPIPRWFVDEVALAVVRVIGREHEPAVRAARVIVRVEPFFCLDKGGVIDAQVVVDETGTPAKTPGVGAFGDGKVYVLSTTGWRTCLAQGLVRLAEIRAGVPMPEVLVRRACADAEGVPEGEASEPSKSA